MSINLSLAAQAFWQRYLVSPNAERQLSGSVHAAVAGTGEMADALLSLYLSGRKTAGSGLVKDYTAAGDPLPNIGDFWIVLDSKGVPGCILRTVRVEINMFKDVSPAIALAEGEGDLSLEYWRKAHKAAFAPHLSRLGIKNLNRAEVLTEFFALVFP